MRKTLAGTLVLALVLTGCDKAPVQTAQAGVAASAALYAGANASWEAYAAACHQKVLAARAPQPCSRTVIETGARLGVARAGIVAAQGVVNQLPLGTTIGELTLPQREVVNNAAQAVADASREIKGAGL